MVTRGNRDMERLVRRGRRGEKIRTGKGINARCR